MDDKPKIDIEFRKDGTTVRCHLSGDWTIVSTPFIEDKITAFFKENQFDSVMIDCSGVSGIDESGVAVFSGNRIIESMNADVKLVNVPAEFKWVKSVYELDDVPKDLGEESAFVTAMVAFGKRITEVLNDICDQVEYFGEIFSIFSRVLVHPWRVRWKDFLKVIEKSGYDALPIIIIIGFLFGLILAFQSAVPMRQFGAEIYIINLVSLTLFRELGPLLTAIIFSARSGAAFTAEIGTMKINEEVNALETMGLKPAEFLALPKILAGIILVPFLTLFMNIFGLIGTALVMSGMGYGIQVFMYQAAKYTGMEDFVWGEVKAVFFGFIVASIGCYRGLKTKDGPGAVGDSTTKSVVTSIIMLIIADGMFAVISFFLGF